MIKDFKKQEKTIQRELKERGLDINLSLYLFLSDFIHKSKHYPPRNTKETQTFNNLYEYFTRLNYAHCGQKPYALRLLLKEFGLQSRVISYSDLFGWAHGFLEIKVQDKWQILDPTFNMFFNIGVEDIIKDPYCPRKILSLYSNEFYTDSTNTHQNFIQTIIDENTHTTFKYNKEWFMFMGFYSFVPPILYYHLVENENRSTLYDIRQDKRYTFV